MAQFGRDELIEEEKPHNSNWSLYRCKKCGGSGRLANDEPTVPSNVSGGVSFTHGASGAITFTKPGMVMTSSGVLPSKPCDCCKGSGNIVGQAFNDQLLAVKRKQAEYIYHTNGIRIVKWLDTTSLRAEVESATPCSYFDFEARVEVANAEIRKDVLKGELN